MVTIGLVKMQECHCQIGPSLVQSCWASCHQVDLCRLYSLAGLVMAQQSCPLAVSSLASSSWQHYQQVALHHCCLAMGLAKK